MFTVKWVVRGKEADPLESEGFPSGGSKTRGSDHAPTAPCNRSLEIWVDPAVRAWLTGERGCGVTRSVTEVAPSQGASNHPGGLQPAQK
jgi:hypothetical protein